MGSLCYTIFMSAEIVKYANAFNAQPLRHFDAVHINLLMAIASRLRDKGTDEVTFTFAELRQLIHAKKNMTNREFMNTLFEMNSRLLTCNSMIVVDGVYIQFPLFSGFETNPEKQTLLVALNQRFAFLVNDLTANFTRFELEQFTSLKSTYSKECYRRLKQFRQTGLWRVSLADFRRLLDVPKSYSTSKFNERVLQPILDELYPLLHVQVKKIYQKNKAGRGRSTLTALEFHFDKELTPRQEQNAEASLQHLAQEKTALAQAQEDKSAQQRAQSAYGNLGGLNASYLRSTLSEAGMSAEEVSQRLESANEAIASHQLVNKREALSAWATLQIQLWKAAE